MLLLDRVPNITEGDEANYHEMMGHVPIFCHPSPKRILVIGGGDGGVAREMFKHPEVEKLVLVDIDGDVIEVSKKFFPKVACSFDDPRMECIVGDGIDYVKKAGDNPLILSLSTQLILEVQVSLSSLKNSILKLREFLLMMVSSFLKLNHL